MDDDLDVEDPVFVAGRDRRALVTDSDEETGETETDQQRKLREKKEQEANRARTAPARAKRNANAAGKAIISSLVQPPSPRASRTTWAT